MNESLTELLDRIVAAQSFQISKQRQHHKAARDFGQLYDDRDYDWSCPECNATDCQIEDVSWRYESQLESARHDAAMTLGSIAEALAALIGTDVPEMMEANGRLLSRSIEQNRIRETEANDPDSRIEQERSRAEFLRMTHPE